MTDADRHPDAAAALAARVLDALPQTQCTRCGYPDCAGYARAIAACDAGIDQCPPGGADGVARLAAVTGRPVVPLNPAFGHEGPRSVAWIDEAWCIGCTLCIAACPVDCIVGGPKRMHTVIEAECTGCERCLPACPVDCIALDNVTGPRTGWAAWSREAADAARARYEFTSARRRQHGRERPVRPENDAAPQDDSAPPAAAAPRAAGDPAAAERKRAAVEAALARARARRSGG